MIYFKGLKKVSEVYMYTVEEAAKILKVTPQYVRKLINNNKLKYKIEEEIKKIDTEDINNFITTYDFVIDPDDRVRKSDYIPKIKALSFFSGAMGLDIGISNSGIEPLLACEINKDARATIVANNNEIGLLRDINYCDKETIYKYANLPLSEEIDLIFGGPPCQAFSTAGNRKGFEDARGDVFIQYLNIIEEIKPKYVVIENVRGIYSTKAILKEIGEEPIKGGVLLYTYERLNSLGYSVSFELYNAANFGAPQKRERCVIIAKLGDEKVSYLNATHSDIKESGLKEWVTLKDVIKDLKEENLTYMEIPESRKEWYKKIPEGGNWKSLSEEDQKLAMGKKYYMGGGKTGFFRRLSFDKPSPTLVTVPTMPATDLIHPTKLRPLAVEEYARIQGFPDEWIFKGTIGEKYRQIGNAVPIKLGEAIGRTIINDINGNTMISNKNIRYSRYKNTDEESFIKSCLQNIKVTQEQNNSQLEFKF